MPLPHGAPAKPAPKEPYVDKTQVRLVEVKLDLSLNSSVGVSFDSGDKSYPVVKEVFGGLEMWNSSCLPEQQVKVLDRLVEVDGLGGTKTELCDRLADRKETSDGPGIVKVYRGAKLEAVNNWEHMCVSATVVAPQLLALFAKERKKLRTWANEWPIQKRVVAKTISYSEKDVVLDLADGYAVLKNPPEIWAAQLRVLEKNFVTDHAEPLVGKPSLRRSCARRWV
eukprot:Skav208395  [mRNA]  locus=scaffold1179:103404:107475:- [translate_table: standard]